MVGWADFPDEVIGTVDGEVDQRYQIAYRKQVMVNTDPQRRCYNGCNFSEELQWTEWGRFGRYTKEDAESSIATFQAINPTHEYKLEVYNAHQS